MKNSIFSIVLILVLQPHTAIAENRFGVDDYLSLKGVSQISLSPDDEYVAFTQTAAKLDDDTYTSSVWMVIIDSGEVIPMTDGESSASDPQWSPDGRYLAILSDRKDETSQVWLLDRRGGDAQQLTSLKQGVSSFSWAPDSSRVLLLAEDATPADLDEEPLDNPRPYVIDRLQFKQDYVGYLDRYRTHVHVVDVASHEVRQVTSGDFDDSQPVWAPDSQHIAFVSNRTQTPDRNRNTDLWVIDTGNAGSEPRQLTKSESADASPSWSPDGESIVYTSTDVDVLPIYAIPQLSLIDVESARVSVVNETAEVQVFSARFSHDSKQVFAITESRGEQSLIRFDLSSRQITTLTGSRQVIDEFNISSTGDIYVLAAQPHSPGEIFEVSNERAKQLTFTNRPFLENRVLGEVEKYSYTSFDDTRIDTFVVFPPAYKKGRTYPGLLYVHGGPQAQWDYRFDAEAQLLASQGYVVVMPNPRGSFGYGQAFADAIYQDWGGIDYEDVMASMDFAIEEGWVDSQRMAVYGWSYGGMMTNHVITKTDRFKAAITGASATLYSANYGHDEYQRWWEEELGLPWLAENKEKWERISPFYSLDKVTTPTLIVGGEHDWNVPIINSEQLYIALKRQGIATQLVVYPNEGHVLSVPSYEKDLYQRYFSWLERYVVADD